MLHTDDGSTNGTIDDGSTNDELSIDGSIKKEGVHNHVGYEPSGREFNSFVKTSNVLLILLLYVF